jgi:DNA-binding transcriptional LysR family regulator
MTGLACARHDALKAALAVPEFDLRQLRYFVAVAEERNFTRAAERLLMTQPALSRAIRSLETVVGAPLLVRGYRDVTLTSAGQVLLTRARRIDEQAIAAVGLARRAAAAPALLRITAGGYDVDALDRLVSSYNSSEPVVPATAMVADRQEQAGQLRDGTADVALMRAPLDEPDLDSDELLSEPQVVLLPRDHPLASREAVELAQLTGLPVIRWCDDRRDGYLSWPPDPCPPHRWTPGPVITDSSQLHALVRLGQGIAFVPKSGAKASVALGLRAVRVIDSPPSRLLLVWAQTSTSLAIARLVLHAMESSESSACSA